MSVSSYPSWTSFIVRKPVHISGSVSAGLGGDHRFNESLKAQVLTGYPAIRVARTLPMTEFAISVKRQYDRLEKFPVAKGPQPMGCMGC